MKSTHKITFWVCFDSMRGMATPRWVVSGGPTPRFADNRLISTLDHLMEEVERDLNARFR